MIAEKNFYKQQQFYRQVFSGETTLLIESCTYLYTDTKITEFHEALSVDQDVGRLDICTNCKNSSKWYTSDIK